MYEVIHTELCPHCSGDIEVARSLDSLWEELTLHVGGKLAKRILEFLASSRDHDWTVTHHAPSQELLTFIDVLEKVIDDPSLYIRAGWVPGSKS